MIRAPAPHATSRLLSLEQVLRITTRAHSGEVSGPMEFPLETAAVVDDWLKTHLAPPSK